MEREDLLRSAKILYENPGTNEALKFVLEETYPELKESEDERIRKELIGALMWQRDNLNPKGLHDNNLVLPGFTMSVGDILAYLEKQKEQKPVVTHGETYRVDTLGTQQVIAGKMPQKPAEWSEEDEKAAYFINQFLEYHEASDPTAKSCKEWFNNRLKSLRPQPKQVWTEEDDRICHLIMANLSESARHTITLPKETVNDFNNWLRTLQCMPPIFTDWNEEDQTLLSDALGCVTMVQELKKRGDLKNFHISCAYDELRSWIRSLKSRPRKQPSWKPSEQEKGALRTAIYILTEERNFPKAAAQLQNILDAFEGKESRKDWKPSEEQMDALADATMRDVSPRGNREHLASLYDDLKKLI